MLAVGKTYSRPSEFLRDWAEYLRCEVKDEDFDYRLSIKCAAAHANIALGGSSYAWHTEAMSACPQLTKEDLDTIAFSIDRELDGTMGKNVTRARVIEYLEDLAMERASVGQ